MVGAGEVDMDDPQAPDKAAVAMTESSVGFMAAISPAS
jgi:hypothetical protein